MEWNSKWGDWSVMMDVEAYNKEMKGGNAFLIMTLSLLWMCEGIVNAVMSCCSCNCSQSLERKHKNIKENIKTKKKLKIILIWFGFVICGMMRLNANAWT